MHIPRIPQQIIDAERVSPHQAYLPGATAAQAKPCGGGSTPPQQAMLSEMASVSAHAEYAPLCTVVPLSALLPRPASPAGTRV